MDITLPNTEKNGVTEGSIPQVLLTALLGPVVSTKKPKAHGFLLLSFMKKGALGICTVNIDRKPIISLVNAPHTSFITVSRKFN